MARSIKKKPGPESRRRRSTKQEPLAVTTISAPRAADRHQRTLVIDFAGLVDRVSALPEPDAPSLNYTAAAVDLIHVAAEPGVPFGRAAPGLDPEAPFVEALIAVPYETFDAAHDLLNTADNDHLDAYSRPKRASESPHEAVSTIMADHVLDGHFFGALSDLIRYSPPEASAAAGEDLL